MTSVCVYCGSSSGSSDVYTSKAQELGSIFHNLGWKLIYGGGTTGLMGSIARATMGPAFDGNVHGIIPDALVVKERAASESDHDHDTTTDENKVAVEDHRGTTPINWKYGETTIVKDMHTRKRMMADESDAFVAMPGGYGTLEEIMECITWSQLGIHSKPIILFNIDGFYDSLLLFIRTSIKNGFISESNGKIIQIATTAQEVVDMIQNYKVPEGRFDLNWSDECSPSNNHSH